MISSNPVLENPKRDTSDYRRDQVTDGYGRSSVRSSSLLNRHSSTRASSVELGAANDCSTTRLLQEELC